MKTTYWVSGIVVAGLLAFAGCGKSDKNVAQTDKARMDEPKFRQAFPSPTPEQQQNIFKVSQGLRYRLYPDALAGLAGLDGDSTLTEPQKKAVADMIESIKQAMTNAPAPPTQ